VILAQIHTDITRKKNLSPARRHRTCPRAVKRTHRTPYRAKKPADKNIRHDGPPSIRLASPLTPQTAA
jgi:hypothetical protein